MLNAVSRLGRGPCRPVFLAICTRSPYATGHGDARFASSEPQRPQRDGPPKDEDIPYSYARLIDPVTNRLGPPISVQVLLRQIRGDNDRRARESVVLIRDDPEPIIKIVDKKEEYRKKKEEKERE